MSAGRRPGARDRAGPAERTGGRAEADEPTSEEPGAEPREVGEIRFEAYRPQEHDPNA